jgi:hypothetical protein
MDPELEAAFRAYAESQAEEHGTAVNYTSSGRDLMRRALKMTPEHSCKKEGYYAGLAEGKRKLAEALAAALK